jgi:hypothetical protein
MGHVEGLSASALPPQQPTNRPSTIRSASSLRTLIIILQPPIRSVLAVPQFAATDTSSIWRDHAQTSEVQPSHGAHDLVSFLSWCLNSNDEYES